MGSGGLRGPQNRCEACKTSWMCSIHIRSRHTLPALLCSRSCCVPQRRCFVFVRVRRVVCLVACGICPDTGEPCTCDGSEPCTCGCGGCGHTTEEEAAAAAYREAHREGPSGDVLDHERKIIVSFDSTFDVMECEQLCLAAGVPGRIMCPQCGGLEHVDETASKHAISTSGAQKRFYLHRNQNETSARRLMRNFAATVRYYPYTIKFAAHGVP